MTYSQDLRLKALENLKKGLSKKKVSQTFGITERTLFNWINRGKAGNLAPCKKRRRKPNKIQEEKLRHYIEEKPDSYLRELAEIFGTSI
ncbi:MAG: transposase, partial [Chlamydiales bacterium]|nr:transposase [Chlamydiales bacterium]